ncbi:phosphopantothenoylcysteine decarboxylase [Candidatus Ruminimicrobiellum ovillum]|uniref:phosphopantothenoylcysteine decarboxylase domain-containing protein n=1 Tax=Candidatus Ruminimicrobiellum ovillum TaxID=1947927 RepID=UPI00355AA1B9
MTVTILITSGPTREYIDPVRFISNASSGKMGKALVQEALKQNCKVIAVKGPSDIDIPENKNCKVINVISAKEMLSAVKQNLKSADIFIGAAAVSDYRPVSVAKNKIKKKDIGSDTINLKLIKNPDIIKYVGNHKNKKVVVGFALETKNLLSYAKTKLKEKQLDMIVANGANTISSEKSSPVLIFKDGSVKKIKLVSKEKVAKEIINESIGIYKTVKTR